MIKEKLVIYMTGFSLCDIIKNYILCMESELNTQKQMNKATRQVLADFWDEYVKNPRHSFFAFLMPAMGSILVFFVPPLVVAKLVDVFVANGFLDMHSIFSYIGLFAGAWLLGEVFWRIGIHAVTRLNTLGMNALSRKAYDLLAHQDYNFYAHNFTGSLTKKTLAYSRSFESLTETLVFWVVGNIFPLIFAFIILWKYSPIIPLSLFLGIGVTVLISIPIIKKRSKLVMLRHNASSLLSGNLSDIVINMLTIKSFAKEKSEAKTYGLLVDDLMEKIKKASDYHNQRVDVIIAPLQVLTNAVGLFLAIFFTQKLGLQAGTIIVVFTYYAQVNRIFWDINRIYRNIESAMGEAAEFTQLFLLEPSVQDIQDARELRVENASIRFHNVKFSYDDNQSASFLENFNLDIKPNQKVGLVGPSGGGKTTITKLILRFLELQSGNISINNQNIALVSQSSLRSNIGYVSQEPLLFHRSLFENIAYGKEDATMDEVIHAAKLAHAHEFISTLYHGYDTLVGERGIKLSGGQRQRVVIARALLKNAPILVLDEATSALDSESEKYIQEGLVELMKDKTALVIAHRLSTIKHLDRIIVLDGGKIVQDGTHVDLLADKDSLYARLWGHQSGEFLHDEE